MQGLAEHLMARARRRDLRLLLQKTLRIKCSHTACARAGDGLAVVVVLHVASSEYACHAGLGGKTVLPATGNDVAVFQFKLVFE